MFLSGLSSGSQSLKMADTNSVEVILDFLRKNRFTRAEAALRGELYSRPDLNGFLEKLTLEEKPLYNMSENDRGKPVLEIKGSGSHDSVEVSKELIVKEIECGTGRNASESKWKTVPSVGERNKLNEVAGTSDKSFGLPKSSGDSVLDLYSWKFNPGNGPVEPFQNDVGCSSNNSLKAPMSNQSKYQTSEALDAANIITKSGEENTAPTDKKASWLGGSRASTERKYERLQAKEPREPDRQINYNSSSLKENFVDNPWSATDENVNSSSDIWRDCSVKTVFPFSKGDVSASYDGATYADKKEEKRRAEISDIRASIKEQVDEVGRAIYLGKLQGNYEQKTIGGLSFPLAPGNQKEELPRLPPVKLKSEVKPLAINWEEKFERDGPASRTAGADSSLIIGSYLDVPVGQEINPTC